MNSLTISPVLAIILLIVARECESLPKLSARIVGGAEKDISLRRYQVAVLTTKGENIYLCGGSLITYGHVLTAGHCTSEIAVENIEVRAGSNKFNTGGFNRSVIKNWVHEGYNTPQFNNDVAVLKLKSPFTLSVNIHTIELATSLPPASTLAEVSGYGLTAPGAITGLVPINIPGTGLPPNLRSVVLEIVSFNQCKILYGLTGAQVTDQMLCAGHPLKDAGQSICSGDSGGPLTVDGKVVGVVSWSAITCGGLPGVFASVVNLKPWIEDKLGRD